jgi:hypothetical protein
MKKIFFVAFLVVLGYFSPKAQSVADSIAHRIANRMKDFLSLNSVQAANLFTVNMSLHNQKLGIRSIYQNGDSVRFHLQRIENTRDSLYSSVLSAQQMLLYQEKKATLISNN